jgi:hypothetical protein
MMLAFTRSLMVAAQCVDGAAMRKHAGGETN